MDSHISELCRQLSLAMKVDYYDRMYGTRLEWIDMEVRCELSR